MRLRFSQDIWVWIGLFLLLIGVVVVAGDRLTGGGGTELLPHRTTYSSKASGLGGLYETLHKLGYRTRRHLEPLTYAPEDGLLFVISPKIEIGADERQALGDWVRRGNVLLIAAPSSDFDTLANDGEDKSRSVPAQPSFLSGNANRFTVLGRRRVEEDIWDFAADYTIGTSGG